MSHTLLIGFGAWGKNHARELHKSGRLAAICEVQRESWRADLFPVTWYDNLDTALEHSGLQYAIIATPINTHFIVGMQCLAHNLHTLIEKPLCQTIEEADLLIEKAHQQQKQLGVGHILNYNLLIQQFIHTVTPVKPQWTAIMFSRGQRMPSARQERSGHVLWDLAPHDISLALQLMGPHETIQDLHVECFGNQALPQILMVTWRSSSAVKYGFTWSRIAVPKQANITVLTSDTIYKFNDTIPVLDEKISIYDMTHENLVHQPFREIWETPLEHELNTFYCHNSRFITDGHEGRRVIAILCQIQAMLI